jgi:hypothetical protein
VSAAEDRERRAAIDSLVYRLRNRGDADDEPFAAEFITALWGRGWRPVLARPDWRRQPQGRPPTDEFRDALKALHARTGGQLVQGEVIPDRPAIQARQDAGTGDGEGRAP